MILTANIGLKDSYNSGRIVRSSYARFLNGFKFDIGEYGTSNPEEAFLLFELYLEYLVINNEIIINSQQRIGVFDDPLSLVPYRDDGYGLGNALIVDMLNSYFSKYDIIFYPKSDNGYVVKTREKTRVVAVFSDYWDSTGGTQSWTLFMNYPITNIYPDKRLVIADTAGDSSGEFDGEDLSSITNNLPLWSPI